MNVLNHLKIEGLFDQIIAGDAVKEGKPSPEIYMTSMQMLGARPEDTLIFEDSEVGIQSAQASGANYMVVTSKYFEK